MFSPSGDKPFVRLNEVGRFKLHEKNEVGRIVSMRSRS